MNKKHFEMSKIANKVKLLNCYFLTVRCTFFHDFFKIISFYKTINSISKKSFKTDFQNRLQISKKFVVISF